MNDPADKPDPPADLPENITSTLQQLSVHELRETIIYAQELLQFYHEPTNQIEPAPGEEIVELAEHPGYTKVVKRQPYRNSNNEESYGLYVYHVTRERHPDGQEKFHWILIGQKLTEDS